MTDQPEALRLAEWLEGDYYDDVRVTAAAVELRRLHAKVEGLRAELARLTTQEPVAWMESPHGAIRANPNYKIKFPSQVLGWQIPLYTHLPALLPDVKETK
jgi:hypothetical protein